MKGSILHIWCSEYVSGFAQTEQYSNNFFDWNLVHWRMKGKSSFEGIFGTVFHKFSGVCQPML